VTRSAVGELVVAGDGVYVAAIDPELTDALRSEGIARELVSRIQRLRKDAGFAVSDRIHLVVGGVQAVRDSARGHHPWIAGEVLASVFEVSDSEAAPLGGIAVDLDDIAAWITLDRDETK